MACAGGMSRWLRRTAARPPEAQQLGQVTERTAADGADESEGFAEEGVAQFASNVVQYLLGINTDPWRQSRFASALGRQPTTYNDLYDLCVLGIPGAQEELMEEYNLRFNDRYLAHNVISDISERIRNNVAS